MVRGSITDFTWGVAYSVFDTTRNSTDASSTVETKVLNICQGSASAYILKSLIRNLVTGATSNLLF